MKRSTDRILTTHAGSLPRPEGLRDIVAAKNAGQPYDEADLSKRLQSGVADIVKEQVGSGIDIVNDGELANLASPTTFKNAWVGWRCGLPGPTHRG